MIRLAGSNNAPRFPGATMPPDTFLGRFYIGAFGGGSNYSGSITHNLNRVVRQSNVLLQITNSVTNNYNLRVMPSNLGGHAACHIGITNKNSFSYEISLVGSSGTFYYYVDLYGDDGTNNLNSNTLPG